MESSKGEDKLYADNEISNSEELDFKEINNLIIRKKRLIAYFTLIGLVLGLFQVLFSKKVWQGEFQIVLDDKSERKFDKETSIASILNLNTGANNLATEVGILESPSVLLNVFDYVKKIKADKNEPIENLRFNQWKSGSLNIALQRGTKILNLKYKDNSKDIVIPVLEKISETYQNYSGKKRLRDLELGINFFEKQITLFNEKSINSFKESQKFALKHDLSFNNSLINNNLNQEENLEIDRLNSANKIRLLEEKLSKIKDNEIESQALIFYISNNLEGDANPSTKKYFEIESKLLAAKKIYKENDEVIKKIINEKKLILKQLKADLIGNLEAQKAVSKAVLKAASRPEEILVKYRQLINESIKDARTLDKLENQYRILLLEKAKVRDPWALITKPTLIPNPISPRKKRIVLLYLIGSFAFGLITAFILEQRSKIIYRKKVLIDKNKSKYLGIYNFKNKLNFEEDFTFLMEDIKRENLEDICFFIIGDISTDKIKNIEGLIQKTFTSKSFLLTSKLSEAKEFNNLILIQGIGITKFDELNDINTKLSLLKKSIKGFLILENA